MKDWDAAHYLAGPLEGYLLTRHGCVVTLYRPDGSISRQDTALTEDLARVALWQIRQEAYEAADAGGHL